MYETVIANLAPELVRADPPASVAELLNWARASLATAEVLAIMDGSPTSIRSELARCADPLPFGADFYWVPRG